MNNKMKYLAPELIDLSLTSAQGSCASGSVDDTGDCTNGGENSGDCSTGAQAGGGSCYAGTVAADFSPCVSGTSNASPF